LKAIDNVKGFIEYGQYCRIQNQKTSGWLHVGAVIDKPAEHSHGDAVVFSKTQFLQVCLTKDFHYEDALMFKKVPGNEIDNLNTLNSLAFILEDFTKKAKDPKHPLLDVDVEPVRHAFQRLFKFVNDSEESAPEKIQGTEISSGQNLIAEQQFFEKTIDVLQYLFGHNPKEWDKEKSRD
jgi:hypothetical protein